MKITLDESEQSQAIEDARKRVVNEIAAAKADWRPGDRMSGGHLNRVALLEIVDSQAQKIAELTAKLQKQN